MLRIDAALDRVTAELNIALLEGQLQAGCNADLRLYDIDAGDHLGHRMLDLHARIHLDEVKLFLLE
jgi:hypothetical protein